ncbi:MAG TPA: Ig-like domain-containing protein [Gemmatimonadaceae bacterium]|jgi:uncharacterized protein YjdB|nr:Ig-like domain-containing protein [Gemmatimonadaceae bacterium]
MHTRLGRLALRHAGLIGLALVFGCGGSGDNSPTGSGGLSKILLTPSTDTIQIGDTVTIAAQPQSANGSPIAGVTLFWSTSAAGIATVNQSGHVTAVDSGTAVIAASASGVSASATIVVTHKNVASITLAPASSNLFVNQNVQLAATLKDSSGNVLTGRPITWTSSNTAAATVDQAGFVLAVAVGSATITAKSGGATGTASITVSNVPVASITITPAAPTVIVGQTTTLTATAKDAGGNVLTGRPVSWTSATTAVATIDPATGVVTGVAAGTSIITATSGGISAHVTVTVQNPPASSVVISPSVANLLVGQTLQLTATVTDASGNPITGAVVTYTSGTPAIASVTTSGLVTGVGVGTALITGKSGTATGAAAVTVAVVPVKTVTITPSLDTLTAGSQVQLTATTLDSAGNVLTGRPVTWTSGNTGEATVSATGLVTASSSASITTNRTLTIFAASGSAQGAATIVVRPIGIASVTITPALDTVVQGGTRQLSATVIDSLGRTVTRTISWSSANPSIASVSGSGVVTGGVDTGSTQITATTSGVSGTNTTVVIPTATTGVTVSLSPANDTLVVGGTGRATATTMPTGRTVTWSSSNTSVATIDPSAGTITALAAGSTTITGTSGSASGSVVLTVVQTPTTAVTVTLSPPNDSLAVGASGQATATTTPANRPVTWSSSATSVATIDASSGAIAAVGKGSTTITATSGSVSGSAVLTVTAPPPASVRLAPTPDTIFASAPGNAVTLTATVRDASNNVLTGVPLTWASTSNVAGVVGGVVTASGAGVGSTTISATTANNVVGQASVVVLGHVGTVVLSPAAGTTTLSTIGVVDPSSEPVSATVLDTFGNVVTTSETLTWASSDPANAPLTVNGSPPSGAIPASTAVTVTSTGVVTETVTITATATDGSIVGTTTINIVP